MIENTANPVLDKNMLSGLLWAQLNGGGMALHPVFQEIINAWAPEQAPRQAITAKVTLQCNECGTKRKVSPDGNYNDRCPKCGGVDWDVL